MVCLVPAGVVTFTRQCVDKFPDWKNLGDILTDIHVSAEGTIEDDGDGLLQVITATHHHTENNSYLTTLQVITTEPHYSSGSNTKTTP